MRVLYAVPTGDQIARFWAEVVEALAEPIEFGIFKKLEGDKTITYPGTQQRIRAKTAWNADTLRGDFADLLILDEWQMMNEDTWELVGAPMLMDNNGDAIFIYTPPSLHSRSAQKARDPRHAAKMFKAAEKDPRWLALHFTTHDNPHVSEEGIAEVSSDMSKLAIRQEIMAEDIDEVPGALWKQALIDEDRILAVPPEALPFVRVVIAIDPSGSTTNEAGIVAAAQGRNQHGYLLSDASLLASTPRAWAKAAVWLYWEHKADRIVGERNFGGDMVREVISTVDENASYKDVTASRGKQVRAEPVLALYEKHIIHHVGIFEQLETEMCCFVPEESKRSPNRMDAMVWAFTELFPEALRLTLVDSQLAEMKKNEQQKIAVKQSTLQKPVITDQTLRCPECESTCVSKRGQLYHCAPCGHEWGNASVPPAVGGRVGLFK